jgi:hypothetical protein
MIADESFPDRPDLRIVPPDGGLARPLQAQHGWTVDAGGMPRQAVQAKIDMFFVRQDRIAGPYMEGSLSSASPQPARGYQPSRTTPRDPARITASSSAPSPSLSAEHVKPPRLPGGVSNRGYGIAADVHGAKMLTAESAAG